MKVKDSIEKLNGLSDTEKDLPLFLWDDGDIRELTLQSKVAFN